MALGRGAYAEGNFNTAIGFNAYVLKPNSSAPAPNHSTAIGAGAVANADNQIVIRTIDDVVKIPGTISTQAVTTPSLTIGTGGFIKFTVIANPTFTGNSSLCLNASKLVSHCPFLTANDNKPTIEFASQNAKIETQATQIKEQQMRIEELRQIVCEIKPLAKICSK